jgi:hypothetical protein
MGKVLIWKKTNAPFDEKRFDSGMVMMPISTDNKCVES